MGECFKDAGEKKKKNIKIPMNLQKLAAMQSERSPYVDTISKEI